MFMVYLLRVKNIGKERLQMNLVANAVGVIGMILAFLSYQNNNRRKMLAYQIGMSLIWIVHFYLLGAYAASAINFIGAIRAIVFYYKGRCRWADFKAIPYLFCLMNLLTTALTWTGYLDILALVATILQTIALYMKSPRHIRLLSLPASPMWMIYDICNKSYVGLCTECFVLTSLLIAFVRFDFHRKKPA